MLLRFFRFFTLVSSIIPFFLPIDFYNSGDEIYSFGLAVTYIYLSSNNRENRTFIRLLARSLKQHDIDQAMRLLRSFLSAIPYDAEKQDEHHYKTVFYLIFTLATAFAVRTEERSAAGRSDVVVETSTP